MAILSYPADQVRHYDHDRFLTVIFAPAAAREHLFALYAFNVEIAKTAEIVSEKLIGQMRLQWWRDTLDRLYAKETVAHAVAGPLGAAISTLKLDRVRFDRLIDAREFDLDNSPPTDLSALKTYARETGVPLVELALQAALNLPALAPSALEAARIAGTAWALTGLLRAVPFHARQRRLYLPEDRLRAAGVRVGSIFDLRPDEALPMVVREIGEAVASDLCSLGGSMTGVPRGGRSPLLLAELARLYLNDLKRAAWDPFTLAAKPKRASPIFHLAFRRMFAGY